MTREELKAVLASKPNKLAGQAIEAIKAGKPVADLQKLVEAGAATVFIERDPAHPRSRYRTHSVLDTCFESDIGATRVETTDTCVTATIGPIHNSVGREEHFRYLLSLESPRFEPGSNGWRGELFSHILKSCFYRDANRDSAQTFARILLESGRVDINFWAANNYGWNDHPENLDVLLSLGANPLAPGLVDCALNYVGCSPNHPYTSDDRIAVVKRLLELGAVPTKNLDRAISWQNIRHTLENAGLLPQLIQAGVISENPPEGYARWLDYQKAS